MPERGSVLEHLTLIKELIGFRIFEIEAVNFCVLSELFSDFCFFPSKRELIELRDELLEREGVENEEFGSNI